MNATSFTPGPWHVSNGKDVFAALGAPNAEGVCTESNDAWQIADCEHFMSYVGGYEYELSSVEQKANARLIAAAPELLAAAAHAEAWIGDMPHGDNCYLSAHYDGDPGNQCNCGKESVLTAIQTALAKARGGA